MVDFTVHRDVVIGVGNPLMGDDGLGIVAVARLRERWSDDDTLVLIDGGTWGMNILPLIECARRLLIIDAIDDGLPPGSRIELERDDIPRYLGRTLSPHQLDLREVMAVAELRGTLPVETIAVGVQPQHIGLSLNLSPVVAAKLPGLLADLEEQLERWGHARSPRHSTFDLRPSDA
ncbi:MAG TPA: HyaD/HybD family hydrogenase maturation endopeptidase [Gemmatimonadaceae bacterium]|jgi:hydrogenase maturation protease